MRNPSGHDALLVDLDGVVYRGSAALPHAVEVLGEQRRAGVRVLFVTNNASRTPENVAERVSSMGYATVPGDVVSSAQAAASVLLELVPAPGPVLLVGAAGLRVALTDLDYRFTESADEAAAVVQGFSPEIGWRQLAEASYAVARGVAWVASNLDSTFPTQRGIAPGNGVFVSAVMATTGREPVVAGKPFEPIMRLAMQRTGSDRPLVIGDRLDTDMASAQRVGLPSLLVMTGVTSVDDLVAAPAGQLPTYAAPDLRVLRGVRDATSEALQDLVDALRAGRRPGEGLIARARGRLQPPS